MSLRTFTSQDQALLDRVREAVYAVEPGATIILYGSRARGDADPDSDWDLLVLLDGEVSHEREAAVQRAVYEVEWSHPDCPVLSVLVFSRRQWATSFYQVMPFHQNVEREGIPL